MEQLLPLTYLTYFSDAWVIAGVLAFIISHRNHMTRWNTHQLHPVCEPQGLQKMMAENIYFRLMGYSVFFCFSILFGFFAFYRAISDLNLETKTIRIILRIIAVTIAIVMLLFIFAK